MSDTLITFRPVRSVEPPTSPMLPQSNFADVLAKGSVVEVLEAVETDFRQGETSMLSIIDAALAQGSASREQLLTLRARMNRYTFEVDALGRLVQALVRDLRGERSE